MQFPVRKLGNLIQQHINFCQMVMYIDVFCKTGTSEKIRILEKTFSVCNFLTGSGFDQRSSAAAHFLTNVDGATTSKHNCKLAKQWSRHYASPVK